MERFSLPPGFRFHPTDEELVSHYLKRKVCGRKTQFEAIAEIDLYKYEPWDLPEKSIIQTRDLEWYFFIPRDRKYPNGSRTNRATEKGYWKSTGKDRFIISSSRNVGTKKTLVYYNGRAPKGERTNWVMHEYRLNDVECQRVHAPENGFVLCRVYQKSGPGPRNGEQYGAPVEDEEFEGSPTFEEGDGSGSGLFMAGLMSASAQFTGSPASGCEHEAVSHNINMVDQQFSSPGNQPRNLEFADWPGNILSDTFQEQNSVHQSNHSVAGHTVFGGYDKLEGSVVLAPPTCHEEDEILQELYELVAQDALKDQSESTDGYQDSTACLDKGYHQTGAPPLSDGDFLELDDLLSVSDGEEGTEVLRLSKKQISKKLRALSGESLLSSVLQSDAVPTIDVVDCNGQWSFGDGTYERQQNMPEAMQMNSSKYSTITFDPQYQPFKDNLLEGLLPASGLHNEELGAARQIGSLEPEFEDVLQFFDHLNACASENKSFNVESLAEDIQRKLLQCEDNSLITLQDGHYYDAPVSFTDIGTYGKARSTAMHSANNHETLQTLISQDPLASTVDGVLDMLAVNRIDNTEPSERMNDFVTESVLLSQGEDVTLRQLGHPPSPLSLLWSCLDSLPTLPASAADLSPKAVSPGRSIRVTATGVGVGAVSVTCTCLGNEMPSSCVKCSVSQVEKKGKIVKSMSFIWKRKKPLDRWRIGFFMSAVFGVVWAIFWLLIAGGAWKVFGGVYRFMIASET